MQVAPLSFGVLMCGQELPSYTAVIVIWDM